MRLFWLIVTRIKAWILSLWVAYQEQQERARLEALRQDMLSRLHAAELEAKRLRQRMGMELLHEEELKVLREEEKIRQGQADTLRAELAALGVTTGPSPVQNPGRVPASGTAPGGPEPGN